MKVLILGGTVFVGRWILDRLHEGGHEVTLFNRGNSPAEGLPEVERVTGDRNEGFAALDGRSFDAIVDTCAYFPRQVEAAVRAFSGRAGIYQLISTVSVYSEGGKEGIREDDPVHEGTDPDAETVDASNYGGLKVLCERALSGSWPGVTQILRPGLICGPWDPTGRFTYWVRRMREGGEVLAPGAPDHPLQFLDVRDLANFSRLCLEGGQDLLCHTVGPQGRLGFGDFLEHCRAASGSKASLAWAPEEFLQEHEVSAYHNMPLWVPASMKGFSTVDAARAHGLGLERRGVEDTIAATLEWSLARSAAFERGSDPRQPGLGPEREAELLAALADFRSGD